MASSRSYLLDTAVFLWSGAESTKLSPPARAILEDQSLNRFVSVASVWELQIKHAGGKLPLPENAELLAVRYAKAIGAEILPIKLDHVAALYRMPMHHRDPFDRMIAAQAVAEGLSIISPDLVLRLYPAPVVW